MERTGFFGIHNVAFVEKVVVPELVNICVIRGPVINPNPRTLLRKKLPEMLISSQRTTTIF